jgi:hypothetical protein
MNVIRGLLGRELSGKEEGSGGECEVQCMYYENSILKPL